MKFNSTIAIALLSGAALFQAACNKSGNTAKPAAPTVNNNVVAAQIALNMSKSISGSYGGSNISDGLTTGSTLNNSAAGKTLNSSGYICGFIADSNVNYSYSLGDTVKGKVIGGIQFFFDCVNGQPAGYTLVDELFTKGTGQGYSFNYDVAQGYEVKSLNKYVTLLSVDGKLKSYQDFAYTDPKVKAVSLHNDFVVTGLIVDISVKGQSNITAGTATFHSVGYNTTGSWDYVGTLEFLPNHYGKITFYGKVYLINLLTGKVV